MKKKKQKLALLHTQFRKHAQKRNILSYFKAFMPEMIFRTTKLEGEKVTRSQTQHLFD